jgi:hypothetical protein
MTIARYGVMHMTCERWSSARRAREAEMRDESVKTTVCRTGGCSNSALVHVPRLAASPHLLQLHDVRVEELLVVYDLAVRVLAVAVRTAAA